MKKNEELHDLVHSLTKSEKRHFRISCAHYKGASNYLLLFDELIKQKEYDEGVIRRKYKNEVFIRQLHVTKHYLKQLILKSLRTYHAGRSKKTELADLLQNIEILFTKERYALCQQEVEKAINLAERYELDTYLIELFNWERKLVQAISPFDIPGIQLIIQKEEEAILRLNNTFNHKKTNVSIYSLLRTPAVIDEVAAVKQLPKSLEAKVYFQHTEYYKHLRNGDFKEAEKAMFMLIQYMEERPERIAEEPGIYASTVNNLLGYLIHAKQYQKGLTLVIQAKNRYQNWELGKGSRLLLKQILRTYNIELEIYRDLGVTEGNTEAVYAIEQFILLHEQHAPMEYMVLFWYQFSSIYFRQKQYGQALKWINKVLQYDSRAIRTDLQIYSRILNLMIHFELKNRFVLGYYIDSTRRFLKKVGADQQWQKLILKYFSKLRKTPEYELKEVFATIYNQFFPEGGEVLLSSEVLDYIDFQHWLEGRM
jgi:tetratricopeptide (TPR) repeat protein